jgi:hypothetical protein
MARFRRWLEDKLPWYDPAEERERKAHSAQLAQQVEASRLSAARTKLDYQAYADRLRRS